MLSEIKELSKEQILALREKYKVNVQGWGKVYDSDLEPVFLGCIHLIDEVERLNKESQEVNESHKATNDDYKVLIDIMDRARKIAFLAEPEEEKPVFRIDNEGNLHRTDK